MSRGAREAGEAGMATHLRAESVPRRRFHGGGALLLADTGAGRGRARARCRLLGAAPGSRLAGHARGRASLGGGREGGEDGTGKVVGWALPRWSRSRRGQGGLNRARAKVDWKEEEDAGPRAESATTGLRRISVHLGSIVVLFLLFSRTVP